MLSYLPIVRIGTLKFVFKGFNVILLINYKSKCIELCLLYLFCLCLKIKNILWLLNLDKNINLFQTN
jgi:hypothetical protein